MHIWKKLKIRNLDGTYNSSKTVHFSKLCFVELGYTVETLLQKISCLSCIVWSRNSAKNFAHNSISAGDIFKDPRKFASFRTFWGKWACLIMKTLKIVNFIHIDSPYCGPPIRVAHSAQVLPVWAIGWDEKWFIARVNRSNMW